MRVFLGHARKDGPLARQLADRLTSSGFTVWIPEDHIAPGDNWAKKIGQALEESQWMVLLLTPGAMESDQLRHDVEFALGAKKYEGRIFSVFVGSTLEAGKDMPWILLKLPHRQVESAKEFADAVKDIESLRAGSDMSHSECVRYSFPTLAGTIPKDAG